MCNLSQGIKEAGIAEGIEKGRAEFIASMHNNGFSLEQIALVSGMEMEQIRAILEKSENK